MIEHHPTLWKTEEGRIYFFFFLTRNSTCLSLGLNKIDRHAQWCKIFLPLSKSVLIRRSLLPHVSNSLEPRWQTASLPQAQPSFFSFISTFVRLSHHYFYFISLICAVISDDHSEDHSKEFLRNWSPKLKDTKETWERLSDSKAELWWEIPKEKGKMS